VVIVVAAAQASCWEDTTRQVEATVLFVDGPAKLQSGRHIIIPLRPESHPGRGDVLETEDASRVALSLLPNLLVQLDRGARMEIIRLALTKDGNETGNDMRGRFGDINLISGRILVSHEWGEALARCRVFTPHGEAATPSNALFIVESQPEKTRVTCVSGWLDFRPSGSAAVTRIPPGSVGQWPLAGPNLAKAEADPVAQEDLQYAIEAEQILRRLSAQKHNSLPR
jgi:hypothetical protein